MKKLIKATVVLALSAFIFAGCANGTPDSDSGDNNSGSNSGSNSEWSYGVDDNIDSYSIIGTISNFASTSTECSFTIKYSRDDAMAYSATKIQTGGIKVEAGKTYRISYVLETKSLGEIYINGIWLNTEARWIDFGNNYKDYGAIDYTFYSDDTVNVVFRPLPISGDYKVIIKVEDITRSRVTGKIGIYESYEVGDIVFSDGSATPYSVFENYYSLAEKNEKKANAIAIIFYRGTELNSESDTTTSRTLGVGLKHSRGAWCRMKSENDKANAYSLNITTIQCNKTASDRDGSNNLEQISAFLISAEGVEDDTSTAENYPAFYFAKNYKNVEGSNVSGTSYENGWYLPSVEELSKLYENGIGSRKIFGIDRVNYIVGGDEFQIPNYKWKDTYYWSSSQTSYADESADIFNFKDYGASGSIEKDFNAYVCCIRQFN